MSKFHHHLDTCERCRLQPFNLCAIGAQLLREAATAERLGPDARLGAVEDDEEHEVGYGHGV